ncbi:MAG: FAD-dependent oxidoreductase [Anaerolineales bacterium]|nr:FAD-dependent oxidoreductase [Anaerolineales bacterium]
MHSYRRTISTTLETGVLVVGGGPAGAIAAIAAARQGCSTILVERYGFLGGASTTVLDTFCGFYLRQGSESRKIVGGIPDLVIDELNRHAAARVRPSGYAKAGDVITYHPEILKVIWEALAVQTGVRLLYHSFAVDVIMEGERAAGIAAAGKGGWMRIEAQVIIDASGDADLAAWAGAPCEQDLRLQAMTTTFRLGGVDTARAGQISKEQLTNLLAEAAASDAQLPSKAGSFSITTLPGVMAVNMARLTGLDPSDPEQLTQAEIQGRAQALACQRFLQAYLPGFEDSYLLSLSTQVGVRESRRIIGDYRLTKEDVLQARHFSDGIARCAWPVEEHCPETGVRVEYLPEGQAYDIPYRCLLPQRVQGLLVAGRCLSAEHDAHASARVMAQCMAMGQAAGIAASLAVRDRVAPRDVNISELQAQLRAAGALI